MPRRIAVAERTLSDDRSAIERLLYDYARCIDRGDYAGVGSLFAHGQVRAVAGRPMRGAEAVQRFYESTNRIHEDGTPRTQHFVSNVVIDLAGDGERAEAHSYYVVYQATAQISLQPIISGRYDDAFERIGGVWCFRDRFIHVDLVGDLSDHLTFDLGAALPKSSDDEA